MKKTLTILAILGMAGALSETLAQGSGSTSSGQNAWTDGVPPGTNHLNGVTNYYNWNHSWSNYFNYSNDIAFGTNQWWKNMAQMSNAPAPQKFQYQGEEVVGQQGRPNDRPKRAGQAERPADVQTMVEQFQQDRTSLMKQLKGASDEQRQLILQQMENLRSRMREQVASLREQAKQQAEEMRTRTQNDLSRPVNAGANGNGDNGNGGGNRGR